MIEITEELYNASKKIINWQVHRQHSAHSELDIGELTSTANYLFCMACQSFDPDKGAVFTTHLTNQLLRLGDLAARSHAPTMLKGDIGSLWVSLDEPVKMSDGDCAEPITPTDACSDYTRKMEDCEEIRGFGPYARILSDKARELYEDILDGELDANPSRIAKLGWREYSKKCVLAPTLIYTRRYKDKGWSVKDCREAFGELSRAIMNWRQGNLPSSLVKASSKPRNVLFDLASVGA